VKYELAIAALRASIPQSGSDRAPICSNMR
jgi:hypothetical protein